MAVIEETVSEGVGTDDDPTRTRVTGRTSTDTVSVVDPAGRLRRALPVVELGVGVAFSEALSWYVLRSVQDIIRVPRTLEVLSTQMFYKTTATDRIRFSLSGIKLLTGFGKSATDGIGLSLTQALNWYKTSVAADALSISELSAMGWLFKPVVADLIRVRARVTLASLLSLTETVGIAPANVVQRALAVVEALRLSDTLIAPTTYGKTVSEQLRIAASLANFFGADVSDTFALAESLSRIKRVRQTAAEGVGVQETAASKMVIRVVASDDVDISALEALQMLFSPALADGVQVAAAYIEPSGGFTTWAINARTGAVTEYDNYAFNSFANFGQMYIGADSEGLYELNGCNDEGEAIIARVRSGLAQLTGSRFTILRDAYLGVRGNGSYVLRVMTGDGQTYDYNFNVDDSIKTTKVPLGKGMRARYVAFELISSGSDFDLESVEFIPLMSQRRV